MGHGELAQWRGDFQIISSTSFFFHFVWVLAGCLRSWVGPTWYKEWVESWECFHCGTSTESVEHVLFKSTSRYSQRGCFLGGNAWSKFFTQATLKRNLAIGFSVNLCMSFRRKARMKYVYSCWYNRTGHFLSPVWDRRKESLYGSGSACNVN